MGIRVVESLSAAEMDIFSAGVLVGMTGNPGGIQRGDAVGDADDWEGVEIEGECRVYWVSVTCPGNDDNATYQLLNGELRFKHTGVEL